MKKRSEPRVRKQQILKAAVKLAKKCGYNNLIRDEVAIAADVSMGLVTYYFSTMCQLKRDVMRHAIKHEVHIIIAQGLVLKDRHARKAPQDVKDKAVKLIAEA